MGYTECSNGHIYDADKFQSCPYCNGGGNNIQFNGGMQNGGMDLGKTMPIADFGGGGGIGATVPVNNSPVMPSGDVGKTVAPGAYQSSIKKEQTAPPVAKNDDEGKTIAIGFGGGSGSADRGSKTAPVVGWLVCIEGPERGKDYRILARNNSIGRSEKMDICIKGDTTISRENHARIAYDVKHNGFHLIPAESTNNVYIGEDPIFVPTKLNARDIIEMGETKLMFVPLVDDTFTWKEDTKTE